MNGRCLSRGSCILPALLVSVALCLAFSPAPALASISFPGINYCSVPPFVGSGVKSNLLLLLDNSASAEDLAYVDNGGFVCSVTSTRSCLTNSDCPSGQSCISRLPYYCYDDSYNDGSSYSGYFERDRFYNYDSTYQNSDKSTGRFVPVSALPVSCAAAAVYCPAITSYLYVEMADPAPSSTIRTLKSLMARGNFLNWLTTSKLDIEKQVLTGGAFVSDGNGATSGMLVGETRGCQGKKFVKAASGAPQVTFAVSGPIPAPTPNTCIIDYVPSLGGFTQIEVYDRQYNKGPCTAAVRDWQTRKMSAVLKDELACLTVPPPQTKSSHGGSITINSDSQIFVEIMSYCAGLNLLGSGFNDECAANIYYLHAGSPPTDRNSPDAICGKGFTHVAVGPDSTGFLGNYYSNGPSSGSVSDSHEVDHFKADLPRQLLVDPITSSTVPDFVPDLGIYNLGIGSNYTAAPKPVSATLYARVAVNAPPSGVLQEFANDFNFGVMTFNIGALSECTDLGYTDCQSLGILDGGKVIAGVGTALGDHSSPSGVIYTIDHIAGTTWSPLSEAFYEAMGYFANRSDRMLQAGDFDLSPTRASCQRNNVLIVSDGVSSADRHPDVISAVTAAAASWVNSTDLMPSSMRTTGTESTPPFRGSYNLDDLAWVARHKNIADSSKPIVCAKDYVTTSVIYTGASCGSYNADGSCTTLDEGVPEKLMQLTAANGGGRIAKPQNSTDLMQAFHVMLQDMAAGSGVEPTIVATGDGNGGLLLREQFYPAKSFDGGQTSVPWAGELSGLWYSIDPFIGTSGTGSTIREDSDGNSMLTLKDDKIVSIRFDDASNKTLAYLTPDSNGDGIADGLEPQGVDIDQVKYLWQAGQLLWKRDLATSPRTIYTPLLPGGTAADNSGMSPFPPALNRPSFPT